MMGGAREDGGEASEPPEGRGEGRHGGRPAKH